MKAVRHSEDVDVYVCDDKAKVPYGEPGHMLSTGVWGKKSLAPVTTTLEVEDHDMNHKGSLTPSVYLRCDVPKGHDKSFCQGQVILYYCCRE